MELDALQEVYCLTNGMASEKNWCKLLALGRTLDQQLKRKILWIWPTATDLKNFKKILEQLDIKNVLSIGCGSGLLEWLMAAVGEGAFNIYGLERDPNWWRSKYAVRSFIPLNYIENAQMELDAGFLIDCCSGTMPCEGKWLILIGPEPALGIHTDPNPMQPQLPENQWALCEIINWTENNIVAFYMKIR